MPTTPRSPAISRRWPRRPRDGRRSALSGGGHRAGRAGKPATRLYVAQGLAASADIALDAAPAHQLRNVLRLAPGDAVALFNGRDGEWLGRIAALGKREATVRLEAQLRPQATEPPLALLFAPIKRARLDGLVEKATELGATLLQPVWTERTVVERVNRERLAAIAVEAAEQSERLAVPLVAEPVVLSALVADWPAERKLILCDESGTAPPVVEIVGGLPRSPAGAGLLIGPEGGFTDLELDALAKLPFVSRVGLGPRVLRADTAAIAALAVFQALAGDWRHNRVRPGAASLLPDRL